MSDKIPESEETGTETTKTDIQIGGISDGPETPQSYIQTGIISDPSAVKSVEPLVNVEGSVIPNQSHTSMSPASFQRGGKSHKKQIQKSQKKRGGKSQKKRGGKSQKKQGRKSQKKRGKK
jgi:hypothetical protein